MTPRNGGRANSRDTRADVWRCSGLQPALGQTQERNFYACRLQASEQTDAKKSWKERRALGEIVANGTTLSTSVLQPAINASRFTVRQGLMDESHDPAMTSHNLNTNFSDVLGAAKIRFRNDANRIFIAISLFTYCVLKHAQFLRTGANADDKLSNTYFLWVVLNEKERSSRENRRKYVDCFQTGDRVLHNAEKVKSKNRIFCVATFIMSYQSYRLSTLSELFHAAKRVKIFANVSQ